MKNIRYFLQDKNYEVYKYKEPFIVTLQTSSATGLNNTAMPYRGLKLFVVNAENADSFIGTYYAFDHGEWKIDNKENRTVKKRNISWYLDTNDISELLDGIGKDTTYEATEEALKSHLVFDSEYQPEQRLAAMPKLEEMFGEDFVNAIGQAQRAVTNAKETKEKQKLEKERQRNKYLNSYISEKEVNELHSLIEKTIDDLKTNVEGIEDLRNWTFVDKITGEEKELILKDIEHLKEKDNVDELEEKNYTLIVSIEYNKLKELINSMSAEDKELFYQTQSRPDIQKYKKYNTSIPIDLIAKTKESNMNTIASKTKFNTLSFKKTYDDIAKRIKFSNLNENNVNEALSAISQMIKSVNNFLSVRNAE